MNLVWLALLQMLVFDHGSRSTDNSATEVLASLTTLMRCTYYIRLEVH